MSFRCSRCGSEGPRLEEKPLGGTLGERILANVCQPCWEAWDQQQIILLNEYHLNPAIPQHYDMLVGEMLRFFGLEPEEASG